MISNELNAHTVINLETTAEVDMISNELCAHAVDQFIDDASARTWAPPVVNLETAVEVVMISNELSAHAVRSVHR